MLETELLSQVEALSAHFGDPAASALQQDYIDVLAFIALLVRHRRDIREVLGLSEGDSFHVVMCLKCETLPIPVDDPGLSRLRDLQVAPRRSMLMPPANLTWDSSPFRYRGQRGCQRPIAWCSPT